MSLRSTSKLYVGLVPYGNPSKISDGPLEGLEEVITNALLRWAQNESEDSLEDLGNLARLAGALGYNLTFVVGEE